MALVPVVGDAADLIIGEDVDVRVGAHVRSSESRGEKSCMKDFFR